MHQREAAAAEAASAGSAGVELAEEEKRLNCEVHDCGLGGVEEVSNLQRWANLAVTQATSRLLRETGFEVPRAASVLLMQRQLLRRLNLVFGALADTNETHQSTPGPLGLYQSKQ